jgi:uncharacterized protein (TIGR02646 family)
MRPIKRGRSPQKTDYIDYQHARPALVGRLGEYCSYCERMLAHMISVEHIQPKSLRKYRGLKGRWDNFLLSCVNCNSPKGSKDVVLSRILLPDRDNTVRAFVYGADGTVRPNAALSRSLQRLAADTLTLFGLAAGASASANEATVAIDRPSQRREAWALAVRSHERLRMRPTAELRDQIIETAVRAGFFSIWMQVFYDDAVVRRRLIKAFPGTARDCFDRRTKPVRRPRNHLRASGKI